MDSRRSGFSRTCFIFGLLTMCLFSLVATTPATAATYYLDAVNGDDNNPGTSEQQWQTIIKAQSSVTDGDIVIIATGNYGDFVEIDIPHTDWITYQAADGATVTFNKITIRKISYSGDLNSYLTFRGIRIYHGGAYIRAVFHVRLYDCTFIGSGCTETRTNTTSRAILLHTAEDVTIDGCTITGDGYGDVGYTSVSGIPNDGFSIAYNFGILFESSCIDVTINDCDIGGCNTAISGISQSGITVSNCYIHHASGDFITVSACNTDASGLTDSIVIEYNHLYAGYEYPATAEEPDIGWHNDGVQFNAVEINHVIIRGNKIHYTDGDAMFLRGDRWATGNSDWLVENNLIYDTVRAPTLAVSQYTVELFNCDSCVFRNNTIVGKGSVQAAWDGTYPMTFSVFTNNIINRITLNTIAPWNTIITHENNNILNTVIYGMAGYKWEEDTEILNSDVAMHALFNNYGSNDFTLASNSMAMDYGDSGHAPTIDILGVSRDSSPDAGCYEYILSDSNNSTPVLGTIGDKSVNENSTLSFSVSATDADNDTITYSATGLPTGATFSGQSFSWIPDYTQAGTYQVTFTVSDSTDQDSETITITVSSTNRAPVLASIGNKSVSESSTLSFSINATDADNDTITYSATDLPTGATFSGQSFSWTPGYTQAGTYQVTFTASDDTDQDSETIAITVSSTNRAPVLASIGDKSVNENSTLSFSVSATDADSDAITYSVQGLPSGAIFGSQTFTWIPDYTQAGTYQVTFTASDGQAQDSETIAITVNNTNRAPELSLIGNKSVYTGHSLSFSVSATDADSDIITYSATSLPSGATFANQNFSWTPDSSQTSNYDVTFTASDGQTQDSETITITVYGSDTTAPMVSSCSPEANGIQISLNTLVNLHITDDGDGVDANSVTMKINDNIVYTGNTSDYESSYGDCWRVGTQEDYAFAYQHAELFNYDQTVSITVNASDLNGNAMSQYSYSFSTEMRGFGENQVVSSDKGNENNPTTLCDSSGNIWVAWEKGKSGKRNIYISKLASAADDFGSSVKVTTDSGDQCNPHLTFDSDDKLYLVWQDNRRGNWDVYLSTSADGSNWSAAVRVTDSNDNEINPVVAVDSSTVPNVYVAWEDDRNGNKDIYIAGSANEFTTKTTSQVTSNSSNQTAPTITIAADGTIYVAWTDSRGDLQDIYAASSGNGWSNVGFVTKGGNQSSPQIEAESTGSILHLVWVDDSAGNKDIYYGSSVGLPSSPLAGSNIVDDTTGAEQLEPAMAVKGTTNSDLKLFVCWQDYRNTASTSGDTDIYFVEANSDKPTNIFVGDGSTSSGQSTPVIAISDYSHPYLVWTDTRNTTSDIYFAGSNYIVPTALKSEDVIAANGATLDTALADITCTDDVSVIVPAGACSHDVKITISRVENPQTISVQRLSLPYEFGPSNITFSEPVTILIPYEVSDSGTNGNAYWYDPLTGMLSQNGITNVQTIKVPGGLRVLSFQTTHFTQFLVGGGGAAAGSGGGGGGGCSMSPNGQGSIVEFLLPYISLTVVMTILKLRDKQKKNVHHITGNR